MKAKFTNFSEGNDLKKCIFSLPKNLAGLYVLDTIYSNNVVSKEQSEWFYSYDEVLNLEGFYLRNKGTTTGSKYKTSNGFINRLKTEL